MGDRPEHEGESEAADDRSIRGVLWSIYQSLEFDKQDAATEELASSHQPLVAAIIPPSRQRTAIDGQRLVLRR